MPAYDFRCPEGHVTEHFMKASEFEAAGQKTECAHVSEEGVFCTLEGEYSPSFWYNSATHFAQRFSPVVIHRGIDGKLRFPAHADAPVPEGFQRVELSQLSEIRALEREVNARDRETDQKFQSARGQFLDGQLAENRRVMAAKVAGFSQKGRFFYDAMRKASEAKRLAGRGSSKPEFYIEAFSQNASNREGYSDARNDFGRMHGSGK